MYPFHAIANFEGQKTMQIIRLKYFCNASIENDYL